MRLLWMLLATCSLSGCVITHAPVDITSGGRAGTIAVHPTDNATMLVASETGGLYKTTDGGQHWTNVRTLLSYQVRNVAYSPSDPNIVIATTFAQFRIGETGIWRSHNGGVSWSIPTGSRMPPSNRCPDIIRAHGIAFDPDNGDRVYVGTDCGLAISDDAGETWSHSQLDDLKAPGGRQLQNQIAGVMTLPGGKVLASGKDGIWHSENAGGTWAKAVTGPSTGTENTIQVFAASPFDTQHIFLAHREGSSSRLYLSINGGRDWGQLAEFQRGWARPLFVRTALERSGPPLQAFHVYFGDGVRVQHAPFTHGAPPTLVGSWAVLQTNHADPSDIAIHSNGSTPMLLTTDGGVHKRDEDGVWRMTGAGSDGYDALQITKIIGQFVNGANEHLDLYFSTQDNRIRGSADGGATWPFSVGNEGFFIGVKPSTFQHANSTVTGVHCGPCVNFKADAHLANRVNWPDAPDDDSINDKVGNPFLLPTPGHYIQRAINHDADPLIDRFKLTQDTGATWMDAYVIDPKPGGRPTIVGTMANPSIYHALRRPGLTTNGLGRYGLVRVQGLYDAGGATVSDADVTGFGSIGFFNTMFTNYPVLGANPRIPNQLIAPDTESEQMKFSLDGGQTWHVHQQLTELVTSNGQFAFRERPFTMASAIQFDPYDACHVLVGTTQTGIFRSTDGGVTFKKIKKSNKVANVSGFYFPPSGRIWVSTYGRGLWKLKLKRQDRSRCVGINAPPIVTDTPFEWDIFSGRKKKFIWPPEPGGWCPNCQYIVVKHGVITGIDQESGAVRGVTISGGFVYQFNQNGSEIPLTIRNDYGQIGQVPKFVEKTNVDALAELPFDHIRGILIEGSKLRGVITARSDLQVTPDNVPYIDVVAQNSPVGFPTVQVGETITITAKDFEATTGDQGKITILIAGEIVAEDVQVSETGTFRQEVQVPDLPTGDYQVEVRQQAGMRKTVDRTMILLVARDKF